MELSTVRNRERLKPRREPYWQKLGAGRYLGVRIGEKGSTWIARFYDPDTHPDRPSKSLGDFATMPPSDRFSTAKRAAEEWFDHLTGGGSRGVLTVRQACERYADEIERVDGAKAKEARRRFRQYVYSHPIARTKLQKLTKAQVEEWRSSLEALPAKVTRKKGMEGNETRPRSKATVNRDMVPFRAALNLALKKGDVLTSLAWELPLKPYEGTGARRDLYLDRDQRKRLVAALPTNPSAFVRGLCSLPLRPGAMAALTVGDFDARRRQLVIARDKNGNSRSIIIPPETVELFKEQIRSKLPSAPLFAQEDGSPWTKDNWNDAIKDAVGVQENELPSETTTYAFRHSTITDLVVDGLDLMTVAKISGTSIEMIEKHYGHLRQDHAAKALAKLAL